MTHVTVYLKKEEQENRPTDFEQCHDVNNFMFETPFTKEFGKPRASSPADQWKRRTILKSKVLTLPTFTQYNFIIIKLYSV